MSDSFSDAMIKSNKQISDMAYNMHKKIQELESFKKEALGALNNLANEVEGALGIEEFSLRQILGYTNVECIKLCLGQAREFLSKHGALNDPSRNSNDEISNRTAKKEDTT